MGVDREPVLVRDHHGAVLCSEDQLLPGPSAHQLFLSLRVPSPAVLSNQPLLIAVHGFLCLSLLRDILSCYYADKCVTHCVPTHEYSVFAKSEPNNSVAEHWAQPLTCVLL